MGYEPFLAVLVIVVAIIAPFLAAGALLTYFARAKQARGHERVYDVVRREKDYRHDAWRVLVIGRSGGCAPQNGETVVLVAQGRHINRFRVRTSREQGVGFVLLGSYLGD